MSVLRTWYDRFQTWLDYTVVADDPNPEPSRLDRMDGVALNGVRLTMTLPDGTKVGTILRAEGADSCERDRGAE